MQKSMFLKKPIVIGDISLYVVSLWVDNKIRNIVFTNLWNELFFHIFRWKATPPSYECPQAPPTRTLDTEFTIYQAQADPRTGEANVKK